MAATPKAGVWRFELRYPKTRVPFLLELEPQKKGWGVTLINGKERIPLEVRATKDKWIVPLQTYQNHLELRISSKTRITGYFVKAAKLPAEKIPLEGVHGAFRRIDRGDKPTIDLSGQWAIEMTSPDGSKSTGLALFDQRGSMLHASIATPTGDYRYIDGVVVGDRFTTAAFDGVFNFVFRGRLEGDTLKAEIAAKTVTTVTGKRDAAAKLPDPFKQTQAANLAFTFPDTEGRAVSLADFKGRPVILQIFGSWCPNCIDELNFLAPWYQANRARGIEVVALSFERAPSPAEAKRHLAMVVKKRAIPYPVLLAATTAEETPEKKLPGMQNFLSFPTLVFLNRRHEVVKVHAGFNGPGTGLHHEAFQRAFQEAVAEAAK
jgi:thiol-disulfide isomerase/thioredoxin